MVEDVDGWQTRADSHNQFTLAHDKPSEARGDDIEDIERQQYGPNDKRCPAGPKLIQPSPNDIRQRLLERMQDGAAQDRPQKRAQENLQNVVSRKRRGPHKDNEKCGGCVVKCLLQRFVVSLR